VPTKRRGLATTNLNEPDVRSVGGTLLSIDHELAILRGDEITVSPD
jgi:hypothetical protein